MRTPGGLLQLYRGSVTMLQKIKKLELSTDFYRTYTDPINYCSD